MSGWTRLSQDAEISPVFPETTKDFLQGLIGTNQLRPGLALGSVGPKGMGAQREAWGALDNLDILRVAPVPTPWRRVLKSWLQ